MNGWNGYDDYGYDAGSWADHSGSYYDASMETWGASIDFSHMADQAWINGDTDEYWTWQDLSNASEQLSHDLYQASWDAYYGPVNADGYTAMDVAQGYSAYDTSFIEPASWAGSTSMISDNSATSFL